MNVLLMNSASLTLVNGDFLGGQLPLSMGFSRSSSGMRTNGAGYLENVGAHEPRFDCTPLGDAVLGLFIEPQRTNSLVQSRAISTWANNAALSVVDNYYTSPDGTQNASQIVADAALRGRYKSVTLVENSSYAVSGYVKSFSGSAVIRIGVQNAEGGTSNAFIDINTATGFVVLSKSAAYDIYSVLLPNGWTYFRYRFVAGPVQTTTTFIAFTVDGASTFSVWGAQIEAGAMASSLMQTEGSAVTRAADQLSFVIPKGVDRLRFVFDDNSKQDVSVSSGAYIVPTNLNRARIQQFFSL